MMLIKRLSRKISSSFRRSSDGESNVQHELQRMTHKGGWKNYYDEWEPPNVATKFEDPHKVPTFSEGSIWPPGRYRCISRKDGRLHEVIWTEESPDAEEYYAERRQEDREISELKSMSVDEINEALDQGVFEALDRATIYDARSDKRGDEQQADNNGQERRDLKPIEENLLRQHWEEHEGDPGEAAQDTFQKLLELEEVKRGECAFCHRKFGTKRCDNCGSMACRIHQDWESGLCLTCFQKSE